MLDTVINETAEVVDRALLALLAHLEAADYAFVTPNRPTHALVRGRRDAADGSLLRDAFGWLRPFDLAALPDDLTARLRAADLLVSVGDLTRSKIRVSTVDGGLFAHSAPDAGRDAVFLGPDSYRYWRFLKQTLAGAGPVDAALDLGTGAGVGAINLLRGGFARRAMATDVNSVAIGLARINARHAGVDLETVLCSGIPDAPATFDLITANPPFIAGSTGATYRDGGDLYGAALSLEWAKAAVERLSLGGRFALYTGAPVVEGRDVVQEALTRLAERRGMLLSYEEIDPDIFGGELRRDAYRDVERIAAVGAIVTRP